MVHFVDSFAAEVDASDYYKYAGGEGIGRGYGVKRWLVHLSCHIPKKVNLPVQKSQYDLKKLKPKFKPEFDKWIDEINAKGVGIDGEYEAPFSKTAQAPPPEIPWEHLTPEDKIKYAAFFPQGAKLLKNEAARVKTTASDKKTATGTKTAARTAKRSKAAPSDDDDNNSGSDDPALAGLPLKRGKKRTAPQNDSDDDTIDDDNAPPPAKSRRSKRT